MNKKEFNFIVNAPKSLFSNTFVIVSKRLRLKDAIKKIPLDMCTFEQCRLNKNFFPFIKYN